MRNNQFKHLKSNNGVTLLEILIAAMLAILLVAALTRIYLSLQKLYTSQRIVNSQIAAARNVISILNSEIQIAGHIGCAKLSDQFKVEPLLTYSITPDNALVVKDSEIFVRYQQMPIVTLVDDMNDRSGMVADTASIFHGGDVLLISDCRHAEIFRVTSVDIMAGVQKIVPEQSLRYTYQKYAEVSGFISHHYFVSRSRNPAAFSLVQEDLYGNQIEAVENVSRISFVRDGEGVGYTFVTSVAGKDVEWGGYTATARMGT